MFDSPRSKSNWFETDLLFQVRQDDARPRPAGLLPPMSHLRVSLPGGESLCASTSKLWRTGPICFRLFWQVARDAAPCTFGRLAGQHRRESEVR